jgi:hypothetical protein
MSDSDEDDLMGHQILLTAEQYKGILACVRRSELQRSYVKKYHLSEKGKQSKARAQRKYRARLKAERALSAPLVIGDEVDFLN